MVSGRPGVNEGVQILDRLGKIAVLRERRVQIPLRGRHQHRSRDAMPGNIAEFDRQPAVRKHDRVQKIAADIFTRPAAGSRADKRARWMCGFAWKDLQRMFLGGFAWPRCKLNFDLGPSVRSMSNDALDSPARKPPRFSPAAQAESGRVGAQRSKHLRAGPGESEIQIRRHGGIRASAGFRKWPHRFSFCTMLCEMSSAVDADISASTPRDRGGHQQ